jgi:hopene-associated glycosyltransferase HpnB
MTSVAISIAGILALAVWLVQLAARGGFWRANQRLPAEAPSLAAWPDVVAVVPARNEAASIGQTVRSLLTQDYSGMFAVVLVDDQSDDATAFEAREVARELGAEDRLTVIAGAALPEGWTGKVWAVEQGVRHASATFAAPYLLLTDADIVHDGAGLRRLVAKAELESHDLVSLMALLHCRAGWERLLIPAFVYFFQMLYPFPLVNKQSSRVAAAAGGCMLVRTAALARAGGIAAIRGALIDDVALARLLKDRGGKIWLGLSASVRSVRVYATLGEIWSMVARTAYAQLGYSPLAVAGTVVGMLLVFAAPPVVGLLGVLGEHRVAAATGVLAWGIMIYTYRPTLKLYGEPPSVASLLPFAGILFTAMTVYSAWRHWRGRGGAWKGRAYSRNLKQPS